MCFALRLVMRQLGTVRWNEGAEICPLGNLIGSDGVASHLQDFRDIKLVLKSTEELPL